MNISFDKTKNYLHLFKTSTDFNTYYKGEDYTEPFVGVISGQTDVYYNKNKKDYSTEYLTFDVLSNGNIVWKTTNTSVTKTIEYKKNSGEWTEITSTTEGVEIPVTTGDKVKFRSNNDTYYSNSYKACFSGTSCEFNACGNVMSLIYGDNFSGQTSFPQNSSNNFNSLFYYCTNLKSVENLVLPATSLTYGCYEGMFKNCTSLVNAPELPAATLAYYCYAYMFLGCISLTTAPVLPATTLSDGCYYDMFQNCASLTTAPELPATTLAAECYMDMFEGCTSLTTAPVLPATTLVDSCYMDMFNNCTSLTTAPVLSATTLAPFCCREMFLGCTGLVNAPALPVTTLSDGCYMDMFNGCTSLSAITCLATDISAEDCTSYWVDGVAANGTFVKNTNMTDWPSGTSGIPNGWTVQDAS